MDRTTRSPFGIRQIARISLGIVRVEATHPRGESRACERGNGSGPHRARIGAKWNRYLWSCLLLAGCHGQGAAGNFNERSPVRRACSADPGSPSQAKCNQRSIVAVRRIFFCSSSTP